MTDLAAAAIVPAVAAALVPAAAAAIVPAAAAAIVPAAVEVDHYYNKNLDDNDDGWVDPPTTTQSQIKT